MKLLVCGGRDYQDFAAVYREIERLKPDVVIHGAARGADSLAGIAAQRMGITVWPFPADWKMHGKSAGPIRNRKMLKEGMPDKVLAFPGGRGTADMIAQAKAAGVEVIYPL